MTSDFTVGEAATAAPPARIFTLAPGTILSLLCALQFIVWTVVPVLVNRTPPTDFLEEVLWSREWRILTYKHPQLPAWLTGAMHWLTGSYLWGGYLLPQIAVCLTFVLVYAFGRELMGRQAALAGVLLLPVTGFFSAGTEQFNHDIAQLPFWAAISWLLWRAARQDRIGPWVLFGLVGGISLYAKFSTGLILMFGLLWLLADPTARRRMATAGPWVAIALVLAFSVPIFVIMARMHFMQLTYVLGRDSWVLSHRGILYYTGVQAALLILLPLAMWSAGMFSRRGRPAGATSAILLDDRRSRLFLLWMGLGPALLLCVVSLFAGIGEAWGKPMYDLVGLVAVAYLGRNLTGRGMRRLVIWAFGMILFTAAFHTTFVEVTCVYSKRLERICMPGPKVAARLQSDWHKAVKAPLGIVAGDEFWMMATGAFASDRPSMFTDFSRVDAPWITPARLHRQGMLVVWNDTPPGPDIRKWIGDLPVQHESFVWQAGRPPVTVSYVIVPPGKLGAQ